MRRNYLLQGDKSSVGGVVIEGIDGMSNDGRLLAFIGAAVSCPACNTTGHIVAAGPRWPGNLMGKEAALDGDLCACHCSPQPTMVASNASMGQSFETGELAAMGCHPDGSLIAVAAGLAGAGALAASQASGPSSGAGVADASPQTPLGDAQPFEYHASQSGSAVQTEAARGVSEEDEAECHAQYERDMEECSFYKGVMGGQRRMDMCSQKAFQRYQQCRGY
ncbi:PAAR domain-containing protein [Paraburkholderia sp. ZP32-5]|uniref:PAAR domain-containing protein n=1 Tax=Paraburkholderia sp. ZP32-5 TaxID=2883245 RepID=UPI001F253431|nr:PAAR domain-containing protein [Paraburkholderia sp. ZP32-5]